MFRFLLYAVLLILFVRAMNRLWYGIVTGATGGQPAGGPQVPQRGVHMVRDPVCGTFVVPQRSITLSVGRELLHFCSTTCRDQYSAGAGAGSRRPETSHGRTA